MHDMARPLSYSPEIAERICEELAKCGSLRAVCRMEGMPDRTTVTRWIVDDVDGFAAKYARAKDVGIDEFVEETIEIADEEPAVLANGGTDTGDVQHAKLRIETRRWLAERMAPRKYGVLNKMELTGANGGPMQSQVIIATGVPTDTFEDLA